MRSDDTQENHLNAPSLLNGSNTQLIVFLSQETFIPRTIIIHLSLQNAKPAGGFLAAKSPISPKNAGNI